MKYNNSPIGIFDSGLGGLTVFKEIRKILPDEDLIYFGDTARVPYGNKSKETVLRYSTEISKFLISKGVKIVVAACNTSSSLALDDLRKGETIPIFGVIEPGAKKAVEVSSGGNIAVIGTSATIKSRAYSRVIYEEINALKRSGEYNKFKSNFKVIEKACPLLVPFVEEGFLNEEITKKVINYYLNPVVD
ncbi:MAG: glutamate racemase, partial [Deltaproteobacteria bacterium]|nr:glutamate racemase [Deltaproteobacteria bacterium]